MNVVDRALPGVLGGMPAGARPPASRPGLPEVVVVDESVRLRRDDVVRRGLATVRHRDNGVGCESGLPRAVGRGRPLWPGDVVGRAGDRRPAGARGR
ncbi:hypothetical protein [Nonomuraea dietziae]|uniref:Uncharacterized protein n=1 Tax=Nonomuraea dietziae TaxID=65515 RepID=A0A7W5YU99_9ACTN|nr:hypothetical protein [Nonomuraea dietziae]MBB3732714.1 hypothetical protein [Nonomuraea dietziae]